MTHTYTHTSRSCGPAAPILLLTALLTQGCGSHETGAVEEERYSPSPNAVIHRLPAIITDEAGTVEHEFVVSNPTDRTVRISELSKACSCTTAEIDSRELAPGRETKLRLKVDLRGRVGVFGTECIVKHDAGASWYYRLETEILPKVSFVPERLDLATVQPGVEIRREFVVWTHDRNGLPPEPEVKVVRAPMDTHVVKRRGSVEELGGGIWRRKAPFEICLTPPREAGPGGCEIVSERAAVSSERQSYLHVAWHVGTPYELSPPRAFFGRVGESEKPIDIEVKIRRRDKTVFRIVSVTNGTVPVTASCTSKSESRLEHSVILTLLPSRVAKFLFGEIAVKVDDPAVPTLMIPIAASR